MIKGASLRMCIELFVFVAVSAYSLWSSVQLWKWVVGKNKKQQVKNQNQK